MLPPFVGKKDGEPDNIDKPLVVVGVGDSNRYGIGMIVPLSGYAADKSREYVKGHVANLPTSSLSFDPK